MQIAGRIYFLAVAVTVGGCGLAAPDLDMTHDAQPKLLADLGTSLISTSSATHEQATPDELDEAGSLDFYGNEVTDAVMEYKLDAGGSLYETHSPQTELPHPTSPRG